MHIADHLRERILTANDSFGLYLRAFIVENEYGQAQLQEYFTDMHKEIGSRPERSISNIGSYTHLDELLS